MSEQVKAELLAIQARAKDGLLHAEAAVTWAKSHPKSALHGQLEWDNGKAANEYRIWQMRRIIVLNIVSEDKAPQVVSLRVDRGKGGGYRKIESVLNNRELSALMLNDALADLQRVRDRYQAVKELASVWDEVERVKDRRRKAVPQEATALTG